MAEQEMIQAKLPESLTWNGPEFHHHEKGGTWNKGLAIIAALLIVFALWQKNYLFAVFIVIATWLLAYYAKQKPQTVEFLLDNRGLTIRDKRHNYSDMEGFAIRIDETGGSEWNKLIIRTKSHWTPHFIILIPKDHTSAIHSFLAEYTSEVDHKDSLSDAFADFFKL